MTTGRSPEGTPAALLAANTEMWQRLVHHPFVRATADGTLPRAAFDRWLEQDHLFVIAGRRFLGRLVELAPDDGARDVLAGGVAALSAELELFRRVASQRAVDLDAEPTPTCLGYSSYVLAAPADGYPVALTVLYGAEKAYLDAWSAVRTSADRDSPYWPFIDNWSSGAFVDWVDEVAGLLDRAAPQGPDERLHRTFTTVARFELRFWDAVHDGESW